MSVRRTTVFVAAAASALVLALSGCGANGNDSSTSSMPDRAEQVAPAAPAAGGAGAGPAQEQAQAQDKPQSNPQKAPDNLDAENRSIIYSGTMTVQVKDVNAAAAQAVALATGAGGFVSGDNRQINGQSSTATLTLRVPAAKFQTTLDNLKGIGDEKSRQVSAQDVTDQVADVDSRLKTAQASVDRIRALMAKAQTIGEITSLESELARRESDLESLQARKRRLEGLTALSTITLMLHGPEAPVVSKEEDTGIVFGLRNGWHAFVASLRVALTVLGWLLPWIVFVGGPIYLIVWLLRRYRAKHPAPPRAPAVPAFPGHPVQQPMQQPGRPMPPQGGRWIPPQQRPVSAPPVSAPPVSAPPVSAPAGKEDGDGPVSDAAEGAEAQPERAPEAAAPHRPQSEDDEPSGSASGR
ncbi:DUF4349 domain-containing protein [Dactylosporangium sp. NPDC051484]|uniref:DUF4349 domain-containing protein n=1 Tax=Dactylosporangium sp. NPDC051484 TaxID=3154942 RepID=UPI00344FC782